MNHRFGAKTEVRISSTSPYRVRSHSARLHVCLLLTKTTDVIYQENIYAIRLRTVIDPSLVEDSHQHSLPIGKERTSARVNRSERVWALDGHQLVNIDPSDICNAKRVYSLERRRQSSASASHYRLDSIVRSQEKSMVICSRCTTRSMYDYQSLMGSSSFDIDTMTVSDYILPSSQLLTRRLALPADFPLEDAVER